MEMILIIFLLALVALVCTINHIIYTIIYTILFTPYLTRHQAPLLQPLLVVLKYPFNLCLSLT